MYPLLAGLRIFEAASFVAGPFATLQLAQLGAEVIRIDPIGGGPDYRRWPLAPSGDSYFWEGLNKGKKSVAINLSAPEGRALAQALIAAPDRGGYEAGCLVTNFPEKGFLAHEALVRGRGDLITLRVTGWSDGGQAVDYTINPAVGLPMMTGPADRADEPVNHVLPAWDLLTGAAVSVALMAARERRRLTGQGGEIRMPLSDVAATTLANLGMLAEVLGSGQDREAVGNTLFGSFGRDFVTRDGVRVMLVGLTTKQWRAILAALDLRQAVAAAEAERGLSFDPDAGARYLHRDLLEPMVARAVAARDWAALEPELVAQGVCFGRYRTLLEASGDPIFRASPAFAAITQPSGETYPAPGFAGSYAGLPRQPPRPAPHLGADTGAVLHDCLGLPEREIAALAARGVVAATLP